MNKYEFAVTQLGIVKTNITKIAKQYQRDPASITLIGASKTQSSETLNAFYQAGLTAVGENYLQEALSKQTALQNQTLEWHFIGGIQSNKTKDIAENFSWVHGIDRLKVAQRLNMQCNKPINALIQLNVDAEQSKNGVTLDQAATLCNDIAQLEQIDLRGFMLIPKTSHPVEEQRRPFALARQALQQINQQYGLTMDTLSMGMSNDLEAAIAEGSTMVRVGTALFGKREPSKK